MTGTEEAKPLTKAEVDKGEAKPKLGMESGKMTAARKRLMRDLLTMERDPPYGLSAAPQGDDLMSWNAIVCGPDHEPWSGGIFELTFQFTENYPHSPPVVRFVSTMVHPNIYADGYIDLDILRDQWNPVYDVAAILVCIQALLCDPDLNDPANDVAAEMLKEDKDAYNRRVRETVEKSLYC